MPARCASDARGDRRGRGRHQPSWRITVSLSSTQPNLLAKFLSVAACRSGANDETASLHQRRPEAVVKRLARGLLDADLRHRAGDHERLDAERAQGRLERGRVERAVVELLDLVLAGQRRQLVDDVGALLLAADVGVDSAGGLSSSTWSAAAPAATTPRAAPAPGR